MVNLSPHQRVWLPTFFTILVTSGMAQIVPPGLEAARTVGWAAFGLTQQLGKKWTTSAYAGASSQSTLEDAELWEKPALAVVNLEGQYEFTSHWQLALGTSFFTQNLYKEEPPYETKQPAVRNELRIYPRLFYRHQSGKRVTWTHSFSPEYRRFYTTDGRLWSMPFQARLRLRSQLAIPINPAKTKEFILSNEVFMAVDQLTTDRAITPQWSAFRFTENQFYMLIQHKPKKPGVILDTGLMHQVWWDTAYQRLRYTIYLSVVVQMNNPFSKKGN